MTDLPKGWAWSTVGELGIEVRDAISPRANEQYELYSVPCFPTGRPEIVQGDDIRSGKRLVASGDVLLCKINPRINRVWIVGPRRADLEQIASTEYFVLRTTRPLLSQYLTWYFQGPRFRDWIKLSVEGATGSHTRVKSPRIAEQMVPIPPAGEQRRIVAAIEEHFSRLDAAEHGLDAARRRVEAMVASSVESAFLRLQQRVPLGELAEVRGGIQKQPKRRPTKNRYPFLRVANVKRNQLNLDDVHEIELFDGEIDKYRLADGDLLVVEGNGSPDQIGRSAVWNAEIEDCVHQNHLIRVRPTASLDPEFLNAFWNSPSNSRQLADVASSTSGLYTLTTSKLNRVMIPVATLAEQANIARDLRAVQSSAERLRSQLATATSSASALRRSILAAAFSGQLVPQDPSDEPASVLLERIAAERAAIEPNRRKKKAAT